MNVTSRQAWIAVALISVFFVIALILLYLWYVQPLEGSLTFKEAGAELKSPQRWEDRLMTKNSV
jgi:hypothetical protein